MTRDPAERAGTERAGRRPDEVRRHNLATVLRQVHASGPVSRTVLGEHLLLNRSTIGSLAAELVQLGLVREEPSAAAAVGRPSHVVAPQPDAVHVLVADVGLDTVTVARVGLGGAVLDRVREPQGPDETDLRSVVTRVARLARTVQRRAGASRCVGAGAAVPGVVRDRDGLVRLAPNLRWVDEPFGDALSRRLRLGLRVRVGNDADLGARAEHLRGAGAGCTDMVFLSGSVGLGGGIVSGGRPLAGASGYAGEVGHLVVNPDGRACRCGSRGCWETEVNEQALVGAGALGTGTAGVSAVVAAAEAGDAQARRTLDEVGRWLGVGVAGLVNVLNPQVVVFGGHLATVLPAVLPAVHARLAAAALHPHRQAVRLAAPGLGQDSPLLGAAELAFTALLDDPVGHLSLLSAPASRPSGPSAASRRSPGTRPLAPTSRRTP